MPSGRPSSSSSAGASRVKVENMGISELFTRFFCNYCQEEINGLRVISEYGHSAFGGDWRQSRSDSEGRKGWRNVAEHPGRDFLKRKEDTRMFHIFDNVMLNFNLNKCYLLL